MSARVRTILVAVAAVVVILAFFLLFIRPKQSELTTAKADVATAENATQQLRAELLRLQALEDNAPQLQADLDEMRRRVPEEDEVGNFIFQAQEAANQAGVRFVQITPELPKPPPEGADLAEVRVTIGANGGYFAVQDFLRRLYALDRAVRIDNLTVVAVEDAADPTTQGDLEMSAVARIFFELPPGSPTTETTTTPVTESPAPTTSP
jgi:Tfp pilus assembly protein PilO